MDEVAITRKLTLIDLSQECVETLSLWVLYHKQHSDLIAKVWLKCIRKAPVQNRLALLYLCNDVLQRCRKDKPQFLDSFRKVLLEASTCLTDQKIRKNVLRVFSIWKERKVYDETFISQLQQGADGKRKHVSTRSPSPPPPRTPSPAAAQPSPNEDEVIDFEPTRLVEQVKKVRKLQLEVGAKMGTLSATKLDISKSDVLAECKDRRHCEQFEKDFDEGIRCLRGYVTALETSLAERRELTQLLSDGSRYYAHQLSDVQLVTEAYRSFASRVQGVKEGLGRFRIPTPPPLPDECPSPTDSEMDMIMSPCHPSPPPLPPSSSRDSSRKHHKGSSSKRERDRSRSPAPRLRPSALEEFHFNPANVGASFMNNRDAHFLTKLKESLSRDTSRVSQESRDSRDSRDSVDDLGGTPVRDEDRSSTPGTPVTSEPSRLPAQMASNSGLPIIPGLEGSPVEGGIPGTSGLAMASPASSRTSPRPLTPLVPPPMPTGLLAPPPIPPPFLGTAPPISSTVPSPIRPRNRAHGPTLTCTPQHSPHQFGQRRKSHRQELTPLKMPPQTANATFELCDAVASNVQTMSIPAESYLRGDNCNSIGDSHCESGEYGSTYGSDSDRLEEPNDSSNSFDGDIDDGTPRPIRTVVTGRTTSTTRIAPSPLTPPVLSPVRPREPLLPIARDEACRASARPPLLPLVRSAEDESPTKTSGGPSFRVPPPNSPLLTFNESATVSPAPTAAHYRPVSLAFANPQTPPPYASSSHLTGHESNQPVGPNIAASPPGGQNGGSSGFVVPHTEGRAPLLQAPSPLSHNVRPQRPLLTLPNSASRGRGFFRKDYYQVP